MLDERDELAAVMRAQVVLDRTGVPGLRIGVEGRDVVVVRNSRLGDRPEPAGIGVCHATEEDRQARVRRPHGAGCLA